MSSAALQVPALVTVDAPAANAPDRSYASGTRAFLVHASRIGQPDTGKSFQAGRQH
jgi:hypothetical protein